MGERIRADSCCESSDDEDEILNPVDSPAPGEDDQIHVCGAPGSSGSYMSSSSSSSSSPKHSTIPAPPVTSSKNLSFGISRILSSDDSGRKASSLSSSLPGSQHPAQPPPHHLTQGLTRGHPADTILIQSADKQHMGFYVNGLAAAAAAAAGVFNPGGAMNPALMGMLPQGHPAAMMSPLGAGVIKVPAHRPQLSPSHHAFPPVMFPWMHDRKDRLTGE